MFISELPAFGFYQAQNEEAREAVLVAARAFTLFPPKPHDFSLVAMAQAQRSSKFVLYYKGLGGSPDRGKTA